MVVYYVPDGFTPTIQPHGNSKRGKAFFPTLPSTLSAIKEECVRGKGPKEVVSRVSSAVGGIKNALDSCELPRNEQQVSYVKRQLKTTTSPISSVSPTDELSVVMHKAYMEDQQFIREVRTLREPAIVVATNVQLNDLDRFCCRQEKFGILTVDPTFCLGDFDVTLSTYRHLLLSCKRSGTHPAFIGPAMVHYRKTFSTYLFFTSTLVGLRQSLSNLRSFGTDGESALVQACQHSFPSAIHLLCSNHVRRNIKDKLHQLGVPENVRLVITQDIFGKQVGSCHFEGLVDAKSDAEFAEGVEVLTHKWKGLSDQGSVQHFVAWFVTYKRDAIQHGLLRSRRQMAGLGDPPSTFTTNASESVNAVLKSKVNYKKSDLPVFIDKLKEAIKEQDDEVERAVLGRGKYQFCSSYKHLERDEQEWFLRMSVDQRKAHLKKVAEYIPSKSSCSRRLFTKECTSLHNIPQSTSRGVFHSKQSTSRGAFQSEQATSRGAFQSEQATSRGVFQSEQSTSAGAFQSEQTTSREAFQSEQATSRGAFQNEQATSTGAFQSEQSTSQGAPQNELSGSMHKDAFGDDLVHPDDEPLTCLGFHGSPSPTEDFHSIVLVDQDNVNCSSTLDCDPLTCNTSSEPVVNPTRQVTSMECQADSVLPPSSTGHVLSVNAEELSSVTTPAEVLAAIWKKASSLLTERNAILPAPGCDSCSRMVKSSSGQRPHLVTRKKSGQYCCDGTCPNWKSLGICSHSVAAAEDNCDLQSFVTWFAKAKRVPNITRLATSQMPSGRGRKGGIPPRKRRKTVPPESRKSFSNILPLDQSTSRGEPHQVSSVANPISHQSHPREPVSVSFPCSSSVHHTNVSVSGGASVNLGGSAMTTVLPSLPPPLIQALPKTSPETSPFTIVFITGNIRICRGCRQKYTKPALPPHNLCVQHKEWQSFGPMDNRQTRFGNVYFHCNLPCIRAVWPSFNPEMLVIPPSVVVQLLPAHTEFIRRQMPGRL